MGAGAVFLGTNYERYLLNDANPDLVAVWVALKERPGEFTRDAASFFGTEHNCAEAFYQVRTEFNASCDRFERAVRLPYLNRFGFNGLYRVNGKGVFNVPFGRHAKTPRFPWDEMAAAAAKLERCTVTCGGFGAALGEAGAGDVVYCDPPYLSLGSTPSFTAYTASPFGPREQRELVTVAKAAARRGATVIISNHDTPAARDLYRDFELHSVEVRRSLSARAAGRGMAKELVAVLRS
jgi:DNA adenine methylase